MVRPLTAEEEERVALLVRAGLSRVGARAFATLARGPALGSQDFADATGLARQDFSVAARELEARGLARVERVASRGRPSHRLHLASSVVDAVRSIIDERRKVLADELAALDVLEAHFRA